MTTETSRPTASQHHRNTVEINRVMRELVEKRTAVNLKLVSSVFSLDDKATDALSAEFDKLTSQIVSLKVALVENNNQYAEYTWHIDPESADPVTEIRNAVIEDLIGFIRDACDSLPSGTIPAAQESRINYAVGYLSASANGKVSDDLRKQITELAEEVK